MKILVLVKQVPDSTQITVDPVTGTLVRDGVPAIINPDDLAGIEAALQLKDANPDIEIDVLTMALPSAKGMLKEILARGADKAFLLTDRRLGGSDTCATSRAIAAATKKIGYDLIIGGRQAIDGDTAQVGPQTAERLGIPQITYVDQIIELTNDKVTVKKALEDEEQILSAKLPVLLTTLTGMNKPRYMNCVDIVDVVADDSRVVTMTFDDLDGVDVTTVGLKGSPTNVKRTFTKEVSAETTTYSDFTAQQTAEFIAKALKEKQLITK